MRTAYCASAYGGCVKGESILKRIGRSYPRDLEVGQFQPMIDSWDLHLRAERKSAKTICTYL